MNTLARAALSRLRQTVAIKFEELPPALKQLADSSFKVAGPFQSGKSFTLTTKQAFKGAGLFEVAADECRTLERLDYKLKPLVPENCQVAYRRGSVSVSIGLDTDGKIFLEVEDPTGKFAEK